MNKEKIKIKEITDTREKQEIWWTVHKWIKLIKRNLKASKASLIEIECEECGGKLSFYERLETTKENSFIFDTAAALNCKEKEEYYKGTLLIEITCISCGAESISPIDAGTYLELESKNRVRQIKELKKLNKILKAKNERLKKEIGGYEC